MRSYLSIVEQILNAPETLWKPNRTGVRTKGICGVMFQHDMATGFPLLTTKKMSLRTIAVELEFFIRGLDSKKWLQDRKCRIWDEWCSPTRVPYANDAETKARMAEETFLGPIYGRQWTGWEQPGVVVYVPPRNKAVRPEEVVELSALLETVDPNTLSPDDHLVYEAWRDMLHACYGKKSVGCWVDARWQVFEQFREDARRLPNWVKKARYPKEYALDVSYYDAKMYSPDTCVWLAKAETDLYRRSYAFEVITPDGYVRKALSARRVADEYGLDEQQILDRLQAGDDVPYQDYRFHYLADGRHYRYALPINQLERVVKTLKTNPADRRMIVSAWNPADLPDMALPPCHLLYQVVVTGSDLDTLNLVWYQRSVDVMLGLPYNIASYALLMQLLCLETGMKPGLLSGMLGDVHIYEDHLPNARVQVERTPCALPQIVVPNFSGVFNWTYKDVRLMNYQAHDKLEFEIAV